MAGSVLKGFGIPSLVLGILLMVAGIVAAGYGLLLLQESDDGLFDDGDQEEDAQGVMMAGAASFLVGLALLILGLVLNAAGNGRRQRALLAAAGEKGRATAAKPPSSHAGRGKASVALAAALGAVLLAIAGVAAFGSGPGGLPNRSGGLFGGSDEDIAPLDFDGAVRHALSAPVAGSITANGADSQREFDAPAGAAAVHVVLDWTPADAGTDELRIILEGHRGDAWNELGRVGGPGPLSLEVPLHGSFDRMRYRVFPHGDASAVVEQPFHVHVEFTR